jgi:hypothetical protein
MPAITTIRLRRGTAAQWTSANPILAAGEMGLESDTQRSKFGDGTSTWTALPYTVGDSSGIGTIDWTSVLNKPTEFNPEAHAADHGVAGSDPVTIAQSQVTDLATTLAGKAALVHTHLLADITDYVDPTIYIDGGAANTVFAAYTDIDGGNSGSF